MNLTIPDVTRYFATAREGLKVPDVTVIICPAFPLIPAVRQEVEGTEIAVGAQNLASDEEGAYTGEVSAKQLKDQVAYAIIGHSERKKYFAESLAEITKKLDLARKYELKPILCFEKLEELAVVADTQGLILAYEPTFAIGSGHPDTPENAASIAQAAKESLKADIPVLYGGSVTDANVAKFTSKSEIGGALVGGASLDPLSWVRLVQAAGSP
jgi:triosephosphate isomerase